MLCNERPICTSQRAEAVISAGPIRTNKDDVILHVLKDGVLGAETGTSKQPIISQVAKSYVGSCKVTFALWGIQMSPILVISLSLIQCTTVQPLP
jgi:hypothetical protein